MSFLDPFRDFVRRHSMPPLGAGDDNRDVDAQPAAPLENLLVDADGWITAKVVTRRAEMHPGRMGGKIKPWAAVVHGTDMHPDTFEALVRKSQRDAGAGSGWHFLLGRTPAEGLVQSCSIYRNANHAGGGVNKATGRANPHGWIKHERRSNNGEGVDKTLYHPNKVAVGIEVHCAGNVLKVGGQYRTVDRSSGKPFGAAIPANEVERGADGRCWHQPTPWQVMILHELLDVLDHAMRANVPRFMQLDDISTEPNGTRPQWVADAREQIVLAGQHRRIAPPVFGHVDLDPARKTDPGPEGVRQLATRGW